MLWPICWVWAFSKPVLYKRAYGTDELEEAEPSGHVEQTSPKGEGEMEILLLLIYAGLVWFVFIKKKWLPGPSLHKCLR